MEYFKKTRTKLSRPQMFLMHLLVLTLAVFSLQAITCCSIDDDEGMPPKKTDNTDYLEQLIPDYSDYICIADAERLKFLQASELIKTVMVYKLAEHISLNDSVYTLDLSQKQAEELGISNDVYSEFHNSIINNNKIIKEINQTPNHSIELIDYKKFVLTRKGNSLIHNLKGINDPQSGIIVATGNDWAYGYCYPHIDKKRVDFLCSSKAAISPVMTCSLEEWNQTTTKSKLGIFNASVSISLKLFVSGSNVCAKLGFKTTDSNGGSALWNAV